MKRKFGMHNMIIRKKIGSFGGFLEKNSAELIPILMLFVCYFLGYLIGYLLISKTDPIKLSRIFDYLAAASFKNIFAASFAYYVFFAILTSLSGLTLTGYFFIPILISFYGVICGVGASFTQTEFGGKGMFLIIALLLPIISFFGAVLIQYAKTAILLSYDIHCCFYQKKAAKGTKATIKTYLYAAAFVLILANICSVFQTLIIRFIIITAIN